MCRNPFSLIFLIRMTGQTLPPRLQINSLNKIVKKKEKLFLASMGLTELAFQVFWGQMTFEVEIWYFKLKIFSRLWKVGSYPRNCKADLCMKNSSKELQSGLNISEKEISKFNLKCYSTSNVIQPQMLFNFKCYSTLQYGGTTVWWSNYHFDRLEIKQWPTGLVTWP